MKCDKVIYWQKWVWSE